MFNLLQQKCRRVIEPYEFTEIYLVQSFSGDDFFSADFAQYEAVLDFHVLSFRMVICPPCRCLLLRGETKVLNFS